MEIIIKITNEYLEQVIEETKNEYPEEAEAVIHSIAKMMSAMTFKSLSNETEVVEIDPENITEGIEKRVFESLLIKAAALAYSSISKENKQKEQESK